MYILLTAKDNSRINKEIVKRNIGGHVKLYCVSDSSVSWYWETSPNLLPQNPSISYYNPLFLEKLQKDAEGFYYCYGLREGKGFLARSKLLMYGNDLCIE